jgi:WD40 repeat protein/tetratricopeptide (TPR) repeat protein
VSLSPPDGQYLATVCEDGHVRLWNALAGDPAASPLPHRSPPALASFRPDGRRLLTLAPGDREVRLWDVIVSTGTTPLDRSQDSEMVSAEILPDGRRLLAVTQNSAELWNLDTQQRIRLPGVAHPSPNGRHLLVHPPNGPVSLHRTDTGEKLQPLSIPGWFEHPDDEFYTLAGFDSEGDHLVLVARNRREKPKPAKGSTAWIWKWDNGRFTLTGVSFALPSNVDLAVLAPRATHLLTVGADNPSGERTVQLWDAAGRLIAPAWTVAPIAAANFDPSGRYFVLAGKDGQARVGETATGKVSGPPLRHSQPLTTARFSQDGKRLITAGEDGAARVWDWRTGAPLTPPLLHTRPVQHVAFSADDRWVLTAGDDGNARVWEVASGEPLTPPLRLGGLLRAARFATNGDIVAVSNSDLVARWPLREGTSSARDWLDRTEVLTGRRLDPVAGLLPLTAEQIEKSWDRLGAFLTPKRTPADVERWQREQAALADARSNWFAADWNLSRLLESRPDDAALWFRRALARLNQDQPELTLTDLRRADELGFRHWRLPANRGLALLRLGRWREAAVEFETALKDEEARGRALIWAELGRAYAELGSWDLAARNARQAMRLEPKNVARWRQTALAYLGAGQTEEYRQLCLQALARFKALTRPDVVRSLIELWAVAPAQGRLPAEIESWLINVLRDRLDEAQGADLADSLAAVGVAALRSGDLGTAAQALGTVRQTQKPAPPELHLFAALALARGPRTEKPRQEQATKLLEQVQAESAKGELPWDRRVIVEQLAREVRQALDAGKDGP